MEIRNAKKADLENILILIEKMVAYHRGFDLYYKPFSKYQNLKVEAESWLKDKDTLILIAEDNGKFIGYFRGEVEIAPDYVDREKIGVVYDVFISEKYRRQGIAKLLLEKALEWFLKKKVKNIELSVDARNEAAIKFWKQTGFFEYKLRMRKDL